MFFLQLKSLLWTMIHHNHSRQSTFAFPNNFICCLSSKTLFFIMFLLYVQMDYFLAYCVQHIWLFFVSFVCLSDAKWLCAWIWPNLLFKLVKRDIRGFYFENSSAASYLLQRVFYEKSVFKGEESIPWHTQSRGGTDSMDWCEYWEMLHLSILVGKSVFK